MKQSNYLIGRINNTHGIKGAVKVQSFSDFDRFYPDAKMYALTSDGKHIPLVVKSITTNGKNYIVYFKGIELLSKATKLKGLELYTDEKPETDELAFSDLIGLKVVYEDHSPVGTIIDVIDNQVQTVIAIDCQRKKPVLLPFVSAHIKGIEHGALVIYRCEGLLDEN